MIDATKIGNAPDEDKLEWGISKAATNIKRLKASRNHMRTRSPGFRLLLSSIDHAPYIFSGRVMTRPENA